MDLKCSESLNSPCGEVESAVYTSTGSDPYFQQSNHVDKFIAPIPELPAFDNDFVNNEDILITLLEREGHFMPHPQYIECVQTSTKVTANARFKVVDWAFEVCDQRCKSDTFYLAVNCFDRLLSQIPIPVHTLQLAMAACLFMASKKMEYEPLTSQELAAECDVTFRHVVEMERVACSYLGFELMTVTPHEFLEHIMYRLGLSDLEEVSSLRKHAHCFIDSACFEYSFLCYPPSVVAAATCIEALKVLRLLTMERKLAIYEVVQGDEDMVNSCERRLRAMSDDYTLYETKANEMSVDRHSPQNVQEANKWFEVANNYSDDDFTIAEDP
eukprot:Colp12_sorted_trinity150504_noHs@21248